MGCLEQFFFLKNPIFSGIVQPSASDIIAAFSTAFLFSNGSDPGRPAQTGQMLEFGSRFLYSALHGQNNLLASFVS